MQEIWKTTENSVILQEFRFFELSQNLEKHYENMEN